VLLVGLVLGSLLPTTVARAAPRERVVHGTIGTPTGASVNTPSGPAVAPVAGQTAEPRCVVATNGGTGWVIEGVQPGRVFELTADAGSWNDDFDIAFYGSLAACRGTAPAPSLPYRNQAGDERSVVPAGATVALVTLVTGSPGAAFTYRELERAKVHVPRPGRRKPTVVAVLEAATGAGFSPYHFDFLGHQHPWNNDDDLENNIDFTTDPGTWLEGYEGATPVQLTLPEELEGDRNVSGLAGTLDAETRLRSGGPDSAAWNSMKSSTAATPNLYWFPGTKVVGALHFDADSTDTALIYGDNNAHGTRSASVAAGNTYGTCPECVFVLVTAESTQGQAAMDWIAEQPWIDVVTNSWVNRFFYTRENWSHPYDVTRPAVESGQSWVWGAGNGADGTFGVPNQTYGWNAHAADWIVQVGGVANPEDRPMNSGRPVDIASYATGYPSAGGATAAGRGGHSGTSNATPVVAGTFAKVVQWGRDLLGDTTPGHREGLVNGRLEGILAEGEPRPCEGPVARCPLEDGIFTRAELQALVFGNVQPSSARPPSGVRTFLANYIVSEYDTTPPVFGYTSEGHGIVHGRLDPPRYEAENRRLLDALRGAVGPMARQPGEAHWFFADSKCRQKLWGEWTEGSYQDGAPDPAWDPTTDQPAMALSTACAPLPYGTAAHAFPEVEPVCVNGDSTCIDLRPLLTFID
jgi:hypothetical protein